MPAPQQHIRRPPLDQREDVEEIRRPLGVLLIENDLQAGVLHELAGFLGQRHVERVVAGDEPHGLRLGLELLQHRDSAAEVVGGRGQRTEHVFVAAFEDLARSTAALHHRHAMLLGGRSARQHGIARVRPEQEIDPVLGHQSFLLLGGELQVRFVVEDLERELVRLLADHHAALRIHLVDRELIGIAIDAPGAGEVSSQLHAGPERDGVGFGAGGDHVGRGKHGRRASQPSCTTRSSRLHHDATCLHEFSIPAVTRQTLAGGDTSTPRGAGRNKARDKPGHDVERATQSGCACSARTARPPSPAW